MTEDKYSCLWAQHARFKNSIDTSHKMRPDTSKLYFSNALKKIDSLEVDYYTTGNYLTAGISSLWPASDTSKKQNNGGDWVFGICKNPEQIQKELVEKLKKEGVHKVRETGFKGKTGSGDKTKLVANKKEMAHETTLEINSLLNTAVLQAMAGPIGNDKKVNDTAKKIFWSQLYNKDRRYVRKENSETSIYEPVGEQNSEKMEAAKELVDVLKDNSNLHNPEHDIKISEILTVLNTKVNEKDALIVKLYYGIATDLPVKEIARMLNLAENQVYKIIQRVNNIIRKYIL